jgi:hypothetical protein
MALSGARGTILLQSEVRQMTKDNAIANIHLFVVGIVTVNNRLQHSPFWTFSGTE